MRRSGAAGHGRPLRARAVAVACGLLRLNRHSSHCRASSRRAIQRVHARGTHAAVGKRRRLVRARLSDAPSPHPTLEPEPNLIQTYALIQDSSCIKQAS